MPMIKEKIAGRWVVTFGTPKTSPAIVPVETLSPDKITRTISSIRTWLKTSPVKEDVEDVIEYEKANANRSGAVGDDGCLTLYLEGE